MENMKILKQATNCALPAAYFLPAAGTLISSLYFCSSDGAQRSSRIFLLGLNVHLVTSLTQGAV